jgi:hypothetical protein
VEVIKGSAFMNSRRERSKESRDQPENQKKCSKRFVMKKEFNV